ncbi:hypothetical protein V6N12_071627 [Hibiscus sabdariffa]|uniref:Cytochrome P450 n=1 Tax=Hibiscus sabdariffa TaxID=183260 RepID=A0ABR2FKC2_9ROSI
MRVASRQYSGNVTKQMFFSTRYIPMLKGLDLDGHEKVVKEALRVVEKYHDPIIDERIQQWKNGQKCDPEDLLDVLISLKDGKGNPILTADEIKAQIVKATEEIDRVAGKERLVEESDFPKLNNVKVCVREAFSRSALGRNPKVWEEPLKFKPERHLKQDGVSLTLTEADLRFFSFSTGLRGCKGIHLGSTVVFMLFARLLQCFSWSIPPGNGPTIDMTEEEDSMFMAKPLVAVAVAVAKPRLPAHVYPVHLT